MSYFSPGDPFLQKIDHFRPEFIPTLCNFIREYISPPPTYIESKIFVTERNEDHRRWLFSRHSVQESAKIGHI